MQVWVDWNLLQGESERLPQLGVKQIKEMDGWISWRENSRTQLFKLKLWLKYGYLLFIYVFRNDKLWVSHCCTQ